MSAATGYDAAAVAVFKTMLARVERGEMPGYDRDAKTLAVLREWCGRIEAEQLNRAAVHPEAVIRSRM